MTRTPAGQVLALVASLGAVPGCAVAVPPQQEASPPRDGMELMHVGALDFSQPGKARFVVDVPDEAYYRTDGLPKLPGALFRLLPSLKRQKCHNDYGYSFEREAKNTELPHLLEHLSLELQGLSGAYGTLKGETSWDWKSGPRGRFHVEVSYKERELAARSIRSAEKIIETLAKDEKAEIDLDAELESLRRSTAGTKVDVGGELTPAAVKR